jgi:uncharacterized membrane protein YfcA
LIAFGGDLLAGTAVDWIFLIVSACVAAVGLFAGVRLSKKISPKSLKVAFGWLVLMMGAWILARQLLQ